MFTQLNTWVEISDIVRHPEMYKMINLLQCAHILFKDVSVSELQSRVNANFQYLDNFQLSSRVANY